MKKISCNIIKDILPLYVDEVVSEDTKEMVDEHLDSCASCREEAEMLKKNMILPSNRTIKISDATIFKNIKRRFFKKKVIVSILSIAATIAVIFGVYSYLCMKEMFIPYDSTKITIEEIDGKLYAAYHGDTLGGTRSASSLRLTIEGEEKGAAFLCYYETPWSKYIEPIFSKNDRLQKYENMFCLGDKRKIDQIYYGEWHFKPAPSSSLSDVNNLLMDYESMIDNSVIIWEKQ